jgi:hypothetical protein
MLRVYDPGPPYGKVSLDPAERTTRMSMDVTVSLPDEIYHRAESLARLTGRDLPGVLADTLAMSFSLLGVEETPTPSLSEASNEDVVALTDLEMDPVQDQRLSTLLDRQQAGQLRVEERVELVALMQVYQEGLLRKAQALGEAVRRGLREPLTP